MAWGVPVAPAWMVPVDGTRGGALAADLAASFQAAIVEHLVVRAEEALERTGLDRLAVGGGVAANGELTTAPGRVGGERARARQGALHRQRRDDRRRGVLRFWSFAYPDYLGIDAYATGERPS